MQECIDWLVVGREGRLTSIPSGGNVVRELVGGLRDHSREPEVAQLQSLRADIDKQILRFDVPMNHRVAMAPMDGLN